MLLVALYTLNDICDPWSIVSTIRYFCEEECEYVGNPPNKLKPAILIRFVMIGGSYQFNTIHKEA